MNSSTPIPDPASAKALYCIRCGYDVRATDPAGFCPECGLSVAQTLAKTAIYRPIQEADRAWVKNIARALRLFAIFQVLDIGYCCLQALVIIIGAIALGVSDSSDPPSLFATMAIYILQALVGLAMLLRLGVSVLGLHALWQLCVVEPHRPRAPLWENWREVGYATVFVIAVLLGLEALLMLFFACAAPWLDKDVLMSLFAAANVLRELQGLVWLVGGYVGVLTAVEMAQRLHDDSFVSEARQVRLVFTWYAMSVLITAALISTCCLNCLTILTIPAMMVLWCIFGLFAMKLYTVIAAEMQVRTASPA